MAGNLFYMPRQIAIDVGVVVPGAKLHFTQTGTSTDQNTYTDIALAVAHANPVIADSSGEFDPIYFDPSFGDYRVELVDANDVQLWIDDDIPASQSGQTLTLTAAAPFIDLIESDASANNGVWRIGVNGEQLTVQVGNDALSSFTDVVAIDRTANTVDTVAFSATTFTNNTNNLAEITKGSFTPTFTGFSADPSTPVVYWTKIGTVVHIQLAFGTGTSNATGFTITNWPSAIQTDAALLVPVGGLVDSGTEFAGGCIGFSSGSATVSFYKNFGFTLWTASSTKGINNTSLSSSFSYTTDQI